MIPFSRGRVVMRRFNWAIFFVFLILLNGNRRIPSSLNSSLLRQNLMFIVLNH